jgi:arginyl-tRNA synthetase
MPTVISQLDAAFRQAIRAAVDLDADPMLTVSQNDKFGDYQSNAAMSLAKQVAEKTGQKTNPRQVAEQIKAKLDLGAIAQEVSIAGPGFINVRLDPKWLAEQARVIARDERLGIPLVSSPQKVVVDYSGPNIAKELHVGHLRSTILGDAASRILEFRGDEVIRQNHLGDWGTQFGMLITHLKSQGAQNTEITDLEAFYVAAKKRFDDEPAFADEARATVVRLQSGGDEERRLWQRMVDQTRQHYQAIYQRLDIKLRPEHERGESFYNDRLSAVVSDLKAAGIARETEGAIGVFVEGYENPLLIQKSGGGYLYGTTDLAALRYRVEVLGAKRIIYFVDARQSQHFQQVFATARKAGWATDVSLEHASFGTMLGDDGKPFKSRTGGVVKLKDLLDEAHERAFKLVTDKNSDLPEEQRQRIAEAVGIGAMKYFDLSKDRTSDYVFSFDAMLSLEGNTAPYLQYAYARIKAIFRKAGSVAAPERIEFASPHEIALLKHVLRMGEILDLVARELKPHHLTNYLYELAGKFSSFYENCPVIQSEEPVRTSRLVLCDVTARTLARGLDLLGIEHPEQM